MANCSDGKWQMTFARMANCRLNPFSVSNNKNYRLKKSGGFHKRKIAVKPTIHQNSAVSKVLMGKI